MELKRAGYLLGIGTVVVMALDIARVWLGDTLNIEDRLAYLLFIGGPALLFATLGLRGSRWAGMGFLMSAVGAGIASMEQRPDMWAYLIGFVLATVLTERNELFLLADDEGQHTPMEGGR